MIVVSALMHSHENPLSIIPFNEFKDPLKKSPWTTPKSLIQIAPLSRNN